MDVNRHSFLVGLDNQLHHLVVVVETLSSVIAGLVEIVLILPTRMCLCHAVEESFGTNNMEILAAHLCTFCRDAGYLCLRVGDVVGDIHIGVSAQLQLTFLFQLVVCLRGKAVYNLSTCIGHSGKATLEGYVLPGKQILFDFLKGSRKLRGNLEHRTFADVAIGFAILIYVHQVVAPLLSVCSIDACPLQRLGVEQHGVAATRLHDERLIGTNLVEIRLVDVFFILHPTGSQIELALWVLCDELLDNLAVLRVVGEACLHQVCLANSSIASQMSVAM